MKLVGHRNLQTGCASREAGRCNDLEIPGEGHSAAGITRVSSDRNHSTISSRRNRYWRVPGEPPDGDTSITGQDLHRLDVREAQHLGDLGAVHDLGVIVEGPWCTHGGEATCLPAHPPPSQRGSARPRSAR